MRLLNHKMNVRVYSVQFSSVHAPPTPSPTHTPLTHDDDDDDVYTPMNE